MTNLKQIKSESPLVTCVLALANHFASLQRLSTQIEEIDMNSDFEMNRAQQLISRFTECSESMSQEVHSLSQILRDSQTQTEAAAEIVSRHAQMLQERKGEYQKKLDRFREIAEKVQKISAQLSELRTPTDQNLLANIDMQLHPLIEEANSLKKDAQDSKLKNIERNADSLSQSLQSVRQKLAAFSQSSSQVH